MDLVDSLAHGDSHYCYACLGFATQNASRRTHLEQERNHIHVKCVCMDRVL